MLDSHYSSGNISVDRNFARFGEKSYAIDKINSVEVKRIEAKPNSKNAMIAIAAICAVISVFNFFSIGWTIATLVFAGLAYHNYKNPNKDLYQLYLMTSSSEVQALETEDKNHIDNLRAAIEAAMSNK